MHWIAILLALTLALISAWLVFLQGWDSWQALLAVTSSAVAILAVLMGALLIFAGRENRAEVWCAFTAAFREDLDQMLKHLRIRKR